MNGTLISLIQSRMEKCTTEQFWATGAITGMAALLISESSKDPLNSYGWIVSIVHLCLACYGCYFVIHRHFSYYELQRERAKLLKDEDISPLLKSPGNPWRGHDLSGVVFYVLWIAITTFGVIACYCVK